MNRSKIAVLMISLFIIAGILAWSWVNFTQRTLHDPTVAHRYLQYFDRICPLEYDQKQVCNDAIGAYHRRCFDGHLRETPPEEVAEKGPVLYSRGRYMECMRDGVETILNTPPQQIELSKTHDGHPK